MNITKTLVPGIMGFLLLAPAFAEASVEDDLSKIREIESEMRYESVALLSIIRQMGPVEGVQASKQVEMVKLIAEGCSVFESMDEESRVLFAPRINEEYRIIEYVDNFYRVLLDDGREGWIVEGCVQPFSKMDKSGTVEFTAVSRDELRRYMKVAREIFSMLEERKIIADRIMHKYEQGGEGNGEREVVGRIRDSHRKVSKYFDYASHFFNRYIEGYEFPTARGKEARFNLSAWGEFLFGKSTYETDIKNAPDEQNEASMGNFAFGGNLIVNERSNLSIGFSSKREAIQTVYQTTSFDAGYAFRKEEGFNMDTRFNLYSYKDEFSELNSYGRMAVGARTDLIKSPGGNLWVDYELLTNNYKESDIDDYTSNRIKAEARIRKSRNKSYILGFRSNFESSDAAFHKFTHLIPSAACLRSEPGKDFKLTGKYEFLDYSDADLKSFGRATIDVTSSTHKAGRRGIRKIAVSYKDFPDNDVATYLQVRGKYSKLTTGATSKRFSALFYTNIFTNKNDNSYTDFRTDFGGSSKQVYSNVSTYFRFWHDAGEKTDSTSAKPYVMDVYGNIGFIIRNVRFGPTFGLHTLIQDGEKFLKRDGNLLRIGGMFEGNFILPRNIRLRIHTAYDYGFVYNDEIAIDQMSGDITYGEVTDRHPTTFQMDAFASLPVTKDFDITAQLNYYRVSTDMDEEISINPVTENSRFTLFMGLRYRYN